jgi:hypothetical protein
MEEAPGNSKESSNSTHANGMNEWCNIPEHWAFVAERAYCLHPEGFSNPENEDTSVSKVSESTSQDCTLSQPSKHTEKRY